MSSLTRLKRIAEYREDCLRKLINADVEFSPNEENAVVFIRVFERRKRFNSERLRDSSEARLGAREPGI